MSYRSVVIFRILSFCFGLTGALALTAAVPVADLVVTPQLLGKGGIGQLGSRPISPEIGGEFTIAAIVRLPNRADARQGVTTITTMRSAAGDRIIVRAANGKLQLLAQMEGQWYTLRTRRSLPLGRWVLVGAAFRKTGMTAILDGYVEAHLSFPTTEHLRGPFASFIFAKDEGGRDPWRGDIRRIAIFDAAQPIDALPEAVGISPPPELGQALALSPTAPAFPPGKALRVDDKVIHPMIDSGGAYITPAPWSGPKGKELISSGVSSLFGNRVALIRPVGLDPTYDEKGFRFPLYDKGQSLPFTSAKLNCIIRPDGLFDLFASEHNTPFGAGYISYYRNTGSVGLPKFETASRKMIGGQSFVGALGETPHAVSAADIDGDNIPDLLVITREPIQGAFPDRISYFLLQEHPNAGPGKGYDIAGNWLGHRLRTKVYWARGQWNRRTGELDFGILRPIYFGEKTFQIQWNTSGQNVSAGGVQLGGQTYLLLFGDVNEVYALPTVLEGDTLRCTASLPLLAEGVRLNAPYFTGNFGVLDIDDDGQPEIIMGGNPGRAVILKGTKPGDFREIGPLNRQGGFIETDTLAVPVRVDWDGDGLPDIIVGDASGLLWFWPGTPNPFVYGTPELFQSEGQPIHQIAGSPGSIQGPSETNWGYLNPTVGPWGKDNQMVIVTNDIKGDLRLYRPLRPGSRELTAPDHFIYEGRPLRSAWRSRPAILPARFGFASKNLRTQSLLFMDWDGFLAMATPTTLGGTDISNVERLQNHEGGPMRFSAEGGGNWGRAKFTVTDWDRDGKWDIVFGTIRVVQNLFLSGRNLPRDTTPLFLRNTGSNQSPVFASPKPIKMGNGQFIQLGHHICAVYPEDLDNDGQEDLIMGSEDGKIYYLLNRELDIPR